MKKIIFMLVVLLGFASIVTSCKKKGCTDPLYVEYTESAEKDNGTCNTLKDATVVDTSTTSVADSSYNKVIIMCETSDVELDSIVFTVDGTDVLLLLGDGDIRINYAPLSDQTTYLHQFILDEPIYNSQYLNIRLKFIGYTGAYFKILVVKTNQEDDFIIQNTNVASFGLQQNNDEYNINKTNHSNYIHYVN